MSLTERYISEADPLLLNPIVPTLLAPKPPQSAMISKNNELDPLLPRPPLREDRRRWLGLATPALLIPFVLSSSLARGLTLAPRVELYTQLACNAIRPEHTIFRPPIHEYTYITPNYTFVPFSESSFPKSPKELCLADPAVQAAAAKLQTVMLTTSGILSALTAGYWGTYGDKFGRTVVMSLIVFGLLFQDIVFIFAPQFGRVLHLGHYILVIGSFFEGILGGWAAFNAVVNAYVSDCTEPGSRANVFSRFAGFFFSGVAFGPAIGSLYLRQTGHDSLALFYIAVAANILNLLYVWFLLPESLTPEKRAGLKTMRDAQKTLRRERNAPATTSHEEALDESQRKSNILWRERLRKFFKFIAPLAILAPRKNTLGDGRRGTSKWDWDLTLLGLALWCSFLCNGFFGNKYMYAEHVYGWGAAQLGYYIAIVAGARALWLVVIMPTIIKAFKPSAPILSATSSTSAPTPTLRRAQLLSSIKFDLRIARISLLVDSISFGITCLTSSPLAFILSTSMSALGGGMVPACHSIALALVDQGKEDGQGAEGVGAGSMFGAIGVLQAVGQNILGPIIFGAVYAGTVRAFPKMIFVGAMSLLVTALILLCFVTPQRKIPASLRRQGSIINSSGDATYLEEGVQGPSSSRRRRGRSLTAKDLRWASDVSGLPDGDDAFANLDDRGSKSSISEAP